jgi:hypothetical protein
MHGRHFVVSQHRHSPITLSLRVTGTNPLRFDIDIPQDRKSWDLLTLCICGIKMTHSEFVEETFCAETFCMCAVKKVCGSLEPKALYR